MYHTQKNTVLDHADFLGSSVLTGERESLMIKSPARLSLVSAAKRVAD